MVYFSKVGDVVYKKLKDLREDSDKLQKEVAIDLKTNVTQYQRYENGYREPPFDFIIRIAKYYNVSIDYIAELSNNRKIDNNNLNLSDEEKHLIEVYRNLNTKSKSKLEERAETLLDIDKAEKTSTKRQDVG